MNVNNDQIEITSLKPLFGNNNININHNQFLFNGLLTSSQPLLQPTTTTNIPMQKPLTSHVQQSSNITKKQEGRQRRRRRRRQRRREQKAEQQRRRPPNQLQLPQQQPVAQPRRHQRNRTWSEVSLEREYWLSVGFEDYLEENITPMLEAYDWEKIGPKARSEQEQINQLEGFADLEHILLIQNETEHLHQIEAIQELIEEEQDNSHQIVSNFYN